MSDRRHFLLCGGGNFLTESGRSRGTGVHDTHFANFIKGEVTVRSSFQGKERRLVTLMPMRNETVPRTRFRRGNRRVLDDHRVSRHTGVRLRAYDLHAIFEAFTPKSPHPCHCLLCNRARRAGLASRHCDEPAIPVTEDGVGEAIRRVARSSKKPRSTLGVVAMSGAVPGAPPSSRISCNLPDPQALPPSNLTVAPYPSLRQTGAPAVL